MADSKWSETVIMVDADYLDKTTFDLIVNFERMIGRRIPPADLCRWLDCIALDGGLQPGENELQALFLHGQSRFDNFSPADFDKELDGKAFKDSLGEFVMSSFKIEDLVTPADFYLQSLEALASAAAVKRLLIVADMAAYGARVRDAVNKIKDKEVTLFAMEPVMGLQGRQEILGYSLMSALGIKAEELD